VSARLDIETIKAKIAEYKGKVNGNPIDYHADKGIISYKPKEGGKDLRDSINEFTWDYSFRREEKGSFRRERAWSNGFEQDAIFEVQG
jgi:hypothetical protein